MKIVEKLDDKIYLFYDKKSENRIPLFCPKCKFPMLTKDDSFSYREHKCCHHCSYTFKTEKGVITFPEKDSEKWKQYLANRKENSRPKINIK